MTINNIDDKHVTEKYIETFRKYMLQFNKLEIHEMEQNEKYNHLLHNEYVFTNGNEYEKYMLPNSEVDKVLENLNDRIRF